MEMHQIRYFLAVAEALNFTRAAEACHVTQPALTRAIQKLEDELGGLLFHRERAHTQLTDLGRLMQPHLSDVLQQTEAAKSTATSFLKLDDAPLNLGVMCTIGPLRFMGFLASFRRANPGIEVSIREGVPKQLAPLLLDGDIDVAVMAQPEPFGERLDARPLYAESFVVAVPKGHRFERLNAVAIKDLQGETYLSRVNCEFRDHIKSLREAQGVEIRYAFRSERDDWIQAMVAAGLGFCVMPDSLPVQPGVVVRPVVEPEIVRAVSIVTVGGRRHSPALAAFLRAARTYSWPSHRDT